MLILKSRLRPIIGRFWKELFGILKENCGIQLVGSTIEQTNGKFPFVSRFHFRKHCVKMQKASQILIILLGSINQLFLDSCYLSFERKSREKYQRLANFILGLFYCQNGYQVEFNFS